VYDGWILDPITMVDMIVDGLVEPLDAYIQADPSIEWTTDVNRWVLKRPVIKGSHTGRPFH
jgi:hypothetical protein